MKIMRIIMMMNNIIGARKLEFIAHMVESIVKGLNISLDFLQRNQ